MFRRPSYLYRAVTFPMAESLQRGFCPIFSTKVTIVVDRFSCSDNLQQPKCTNNQKMKEMVPWNWFPINKKFQPQEWAAIASWFYVWLHLISDMVHKPYRNYMHLWICKAKGKMVCNHILDSLFCLWLSCGTPDEEESIESALVLPPLTTSISKLHDQ